MVRIGDDRVRLVPHDVFLLDNDFDVLVDDDMVHIPHPGNFMQIGGLNAAVRSAAPRNLTVLRDTLCQWRRNSGPLWRQKSVPPG